MTLPDNFYKLPAPKDLMRICKAVSALDAMLCPDWELRYYSFNSKWSENEEFFEMRDGEGNHLLILFQANGVVINGFSIDSEHTKIEKATLNLPEQFEEFIFGEPVKSIGSTFCIWNIEPDEWNSGVLNFDEKSENMLAIFDGNPNTYIDWAIDYHGDYFITGSDTFDLVSKIYNGDILTKEMASSIAAEEIDWEQLSMDLKEINYNYSF